MNGKMTILNPKPGTLRGRFLRRPFLEASTMPVLPGAPGPPKMANSMIISSYPGHLDPAPARFLILVSAVRVRTGAPFHQEPERFGDD